MIEVKSDNQKFLPIRVCNNRIWNIHVSLLPKCQFGRISGTQAGVTEHLAIYTYGCLNSQQLFAIRMTCRYAYTHVALVSSTQQQL